MVRSLQVSSLNQKLDRSTPVEFATSANLVWVSSGLKNEEN